MKNKDLIKQENAQIMQSLSDALKNNDVEGAATALQKLQDTIGERISSEFEQYKDITDMSVLQSRGLRSLTSDETEWYQAFIGAVKTGTKQAITNLTSAMPATIIDRVIEDMRKAHPLLDAIDILNAAGATKLVMNGIQMASKLGTWKAVGTSITQELTGSLKVVDLTAAKYTAYFVIPKDFVKFNFGFAPMWVDAYIRNVLSESCAFGLEKTIVQGDGDGQFIGLAFDTEQVVQNKHSEKTAVALSDWDDYAGLIADELLTDDNGDYRNVTEVLMVVNPIDFVKIINPSQHAITPAGVIDKINNEFPTRVVTSAFCAEHSMKLGIAANYFAAINGGTSGIIEFSDEAQFLDDNRVYTTRMYGMGRPVDNTSFINVNITNLERYAYPVKVKGTVKTKEQA